MSVVWTETAAAQLLAIKNYLEQSSVEYAQTLTRRILSRTEALENQPRFGAMVLEYGDPNIREVFEHPYRILYRVVNQDVQVIGVIHTSRRFPMSPLTRG